MKRSLFFTALIATVIYSGTSLTSCKKEEDTKASITVFDTVGAPLPGANVILWQDTAHNPITGEKSTIRVNGTTDGSGNVEFIFPNEAFLNIWAIYGADTAFGFIRLEQFKTTEATVFF